MIHAGTIRTGSGQTFGVVGAYWINSISSLRKTILPFAVATDLPTAKFGSGCGRGYQGGPVLEPVVQARYEVSTARLHDLAEYSRVAEWEIRGRDGVKTLTDRKVHDRRIRSREAANVRRRQMPPLFAQ